MKRVEVFSNIMKRAFKSNLIHYLVFIVVLIAIIISMLHCTLLAVGDDVSDEQEAVVEQEEAGGEGAYQTELTSNEIDGELKSGSISGMLWLDMFEDTENGTYSGDGIYEADEKPLANYDVNLYKTDDMASAVQETKTNDIGEYYFEGVEPGEYVVGITTATIDDVEYLLPLVGISGDNKFEIDNEFEENAYSEPIEVDLGTEEDTVDAGMRVRFGTMARGLVNYSFSYNGYFRVQDEYGKNMKGVGWELYKYKNNDDNTYAYYVLEASGSTDDNGYTQFNATHDPYLEQGKWYGFRYSFQVPEGITHWDVNGFSSNNVKVEAFNQHAKVESGKYNILAGLGVKISASNRLHFSYGSRRDPVIIRMLREIIVKFDTQGGVLPKSWRKLEWDYWSYQTFKVRTNEFEKQNIINALPTPTRGKWEFKGWYTAQTGGNQVTETDTTGIIFPSPANTGTLYARWSTNITEKYVDENGNPLTDDTSTTIISPDSVYKYSGSIDSITKNNDTYTYVGYQVGELSPEQTITEGTPTIDDVMGGEIVYLIYTKTTNLTILKVDSNGNTEPLAGAKFNLYFCSDTSNTHTHASINDTHSCWKWVSTETSGDGDSITKGLVEFSDLARGIYLLEEIQAPSGYQLPTGQWILEIGGNEGAIVSGGTLTSSNIPALKMPSYEQKNAGIDILVGNTKTLELPLSGGAETSWFMAIGGLLIAGGVGWIHKVRSKKTP